MEDLDVSNESMASLLRITNVRTRNLNDWQRSNSGVLWITGFFGSGHRRLAKDIAGDDAKITNFDALYLKRDKGGDIDINVINEIKEEIKSRGEKVIVVGTFLSLADFDTSDSIALLETGILTSSRRHASEEFKGQKGSKFLALVENAYFWRGIKSIQKLTRPDIRFNYIVQKFSGTTSSNENFKQPPSAKW